MRAYSGKGMCVKYVSLYLFSYRLNVGKNKKSHNNNYITITID